MVMARMLPFLVVEAGRSGESGEEDRDVRCVVSTEIPVSSGKELSPPGRNPRPQGQCIYSLSPSDASVDTDPEDQGIHTVSKWVP